MTSGYSSLEAASNRGRRRMFTAPEREFQNPAYRATPAVTLRHREMKSGEGKRGSIAKRWSRRTRTSRQRQTCRSFGRADVDTSLDGRGRAQPFGGGRTFGARNATTGSSAVRSVRGRWPSSRRRCYRPGLRWPVGGPRKTFRGRLRALSLSRRPNWGDCRQCPLTAALQRAGVPESYLASVANRSVTCPTRLVTRTK